MNIIDTLAGNRRQFCAGLLGLAALVCGCGEGGESSAPITPPGGKPPGEAEREARQKAFGPSANPKTTKEAPKPAPEPPKTN